jgi:hypothetical protein
MYIATGFSFIMLYCIVYVCLLCLIHYDKNVGVIIWLYTNYVFSLPKKLCHLIW